MNPANPSVAALNIAIKKAGSQSALARLIGKKQPHIHKWLHSPRPMRAENCVLVGEAVGIPYWQFRPDDWRDVWPDLRRPELQAVYQLEREELQ
ncbi:transcriptional regulator [Burkholderia perseverans]|uniref:transcriptional regulator n=1 Tax=Burkholderia perseverans TaxID=2615214 RepID=UPI001FEE7035|nr:YdaS family helix-turn-helix protein [Burkholderia perseverans]